MSAISPIEYISHESSNPPRRLHHFKVDPKQTTIELVNASDTCIGLETVTSMAKRKGATLAINGGWFQGDPLLGAPDGPFKMQGSILGSKGTLSGALGWKIGGAFTLIDRIVISSSIFCAGQIFPISGINRKMTEEAAILYTPAFNKTTMTPPGVLEIEITRGKFSKILGKKGSSSIPLDGAIYALGKKQAPLFKLALVNKTIDIRHIIKPFFFSQAAPLWKSADYILNGNIILFDKKLITDYQKEALAQNIYENNYARTSIGIDERQIWHIVIVEANHKDKQGMSLKRLAQFMLEIGCKAAIAIDGGGSSTVYYRDATHYFQAHTHHSYQQNNVFYHPNGGERPVGNAIIVKLKGK